MTAARPNAREHLSGLVGTTIPTFTGKPNTIIAIRGNDVIVGTTPSPTGKPVPIADVQAAIDMLYEKGELPIEKTVVGYRSAFIGAVLLTLRGVERGDGTRRVRLVDR